MGEVSRCEPLPQEPARVSHEDVERRQPPQSVEEQELSSRVAHRAGDCSFNRSRAPRLRIRRSICSRRFRRACTRKYRARVAEAIEVGELSKQLLDARHGTPLAVPCDDSSRQPFVSVESRCRDPPRQERIDHGQRGVQGAPAPPVGGQRRPTGRRRFRGPTTWPGRGGRSPAPAK